MVVVLVVIYLFICLAAICKLENEAVLLDILSFWTWQHQKRSNSARRPYFLNLTTSKTKYSARLPHFSKLTTSKTSNSAWLPHFQTSQHRKRNNSAWLPHFSKLTTSKAKKFCDTFSFFELDNIQNEAILRDVFNFWLWQHQKQMNSARRPSKMESWVQSDSLVPMRFAIFPLHLSKVVRLPRKIDARSYEVLHLSRKIILPNLQIWCSKMQPLSGNQRPDLLTSLMNMSFVLRLPGEMHLWRSSSNVPRLPLFLEMLQNPHVLLTFDKVRNPLHLPRESTSERPKVLRIRQFFALVTSKCASRNNRVHFFGASTSKSGPNMVCFVHFDLEMCFAPQWRALFRRLNFPQWS